MRLSGEPPASLGDGAFSWGKFVVLVASPAAQAAPPELVVLDALGDSYASGAGVPPYAACGRSQAAYAVQIQGRMRIELDDFAACAGATTTSLVAQGQLDALDADTDLVTLTIGGNDTAWSSAVAACLFGSDGQCSATSTAVRAEITDDLPGLLDAVYAQIAARAPQAHVVVTGYPRLFSPEYGAYLGMSVAEQQTLNEGADLLNAVIAEAAAEHGFVFVRHQALPRPRCECTGRVDPGPLRPGCLPPER